VNRARQTLDGVAGKSVNVAKVLRALGGRPCAVGLVGPQRGVLLRQVLEARALTATSFPWRLKRVSV